MTASRLTAVILAFGLLPSLALAHPGHEVPGFAAGLSHPFSGLDHLLAMVAMGAWTSAVHGPRGWRVALSFAAGMLAGAGLGLTGFALPLAETLIAFSVMAIGALLLAPRRLPLAAACGLAASLALVHGYAHGSELPASAAAAAWLGGMVVATLVLHLTGAALALACRRQPLGLQATGALVALAGAGLLLGL